MNREPFKKGLNKLGIDSDENGVYVYFKFNFIFLIIIFSLFICILNVGIFLLALLSLIYDMVHYMSYHLVYGLVFLTYIIGILGLMTTIIYKIENKVMGNKDLRFKDKNLILGKTYNLK